MHKEIVLLVQKNAERSCFSLATGSDGAVIPCAFFPRTTPSVLWQNTFPYCNSRLFWKKSKRKPLPAPCARLLAPFPGSAGWVERLSLLDFPRLVRVCVVQQRERTPAYIPGLVFPTRKERRGLTLFFSSERGCVFVASLFQNSQLRWERLSMRLVSFCASAFQKNREWDLWGQKWQG